MPRVLIGPIIGLVTSDSARILFEVDEECSVSIRVEDGSTGRAVMVTQTLQPRIATIFKFSRLEPETRYTVRVPNFDHVDSSFKTFPVHPTMEHKLNFAFASCNNFRITKEEVDPISCVWTKLADQAQAGEIDMVLHLGDQVYGDDDWSNFEDSHGKKVSLEQILQYCRFAQALEIVKDLPVEELEQHRPRVTELYRQCYRDAWGTFAPAARAMANCCHIMMYDDHDIRDDLGDKLPEFDPTSPVYFVIQCGRRACFDYQRQLYEDFDMPDPYIMPRVAKENHLTHLLGEYGIIMIDSRGAKTFNRVEDDTMPFLTSAQWVDIERDLQPERGTLAECKLLLAVTQVPVCFFPPGITEKIALKADDFEGMWSYKQNSKEQICLMNALHNWRKGRDGRMIYLVGGDVHLAGHSQIYHNEEFVMNQMICGPTSNRTLGKVEFAVTRMLKECGENLAEGWSYEHYGWEPKRNYGLLKTKPGANDDEALEFSHMTAVSNTKPVKEVIVPQPAKGGRWYEQWTGSWSWGGHK